VLPENVLKTLSAPSAFLEPDGRERNPLEDFEQGGVAMGNASMGLQYQSWRAWWVDGVVYLAPVFGGTPTALFTLANVTELSLSFDQGMRPCVAYVAGGQAGLRWFDATVGDYAVLPLPGAASPFLTLDDKRPDFVAASDVLLFYLLDGGVWYRQQRDRFAVARRLANIPTFTQRITRCGMGVNNRLQIEFSG
jgi:hypothetical protein